MTDDFYYELTGPRQLERRGINRENLHPGPQQVVAETLATAISPGTELAAYSGANPLRPGRTYPRLQGYCNVARIVRTGEGTAPYRPGDCILTFQSHRSVFMCSTRDVLLHLPGDVDVIKSACTYLYHLGYYALLDGGVMPTHNLTILGGGTLGVTTAQLADLKGIPVQLISDHMNLPGATVRSRKWFHENESVAGVMASQDRVVATTNSWEDWLIGLKLLKRNGVMAVLGFPGRHEPVPPFNPIASQYFYDKQLTIKATGDMPEEYVSPDGSVYTLKKNLQYLHAQLMQGVLDTTLIVSEVTVGHQLARVYEHMVTNRGDYRTAVLLWKSI